MKNAKALLGLEAYRAEEPFWLWEAAVVSYRATIRALLVSIWLTFERAASLAACPP